MKKRRKIIIAVVSIFIVILYAMFSLEKDDKELIETQVLFGEFIVQVTTTGELQAKNSEEILAPLDLRSRNLRFGNVKIQDLVPEGTLVDSGEYVAMLDPSEATNKFKDLDDELQKMESQFTKIQLDTTMRMRELRDQLINIKFEVEERRLVVKQSIYEPPTTLRQAKISFEKAQRAYKQALRNYKLKQIQAEAEMKGASINLAQQLRKIKEMEEVISAFKIMAPKSGMVIYKKEWNGKKRKVGSDISPWDLVVATLPDLSKMVSKTYVNEVDISKIEEGQRVEIGIDAFPEKKYRGKVSYISNIGDKILNTNAKVFEVMIDVEDMDSILRPAMTTSNEIRIKSFENVLYIPLEALHTNDSLSYVFTKNRKKQIVVPGISNEDFVIIEKGLAQGDKLYLSIPSKAEEWNFMGEELIPFIKSRKLKDEPKKYDKEKQENRMETEEEISEEEILTP